jgi:hypothetical protein
MTGRRCYAIDLGPDYCALVIARWEQHSGGKARLIERGVR